MKLSHCSLILFLALKDLAIFRFFPIANVIFVSEMESSPHPALAFLDLDFTDEFRDILDNFIHFLSYFPFLL